MTAADKAARLLAEHRVQVKWCTDQLTQAAVRGDTSVYDVRWTRLVGWHCTCACLGPRCSHIAAVRTITTRSVNAPEPVS